MGCHPHGANILKPNLPLRTAPQLAEFKSFEKFIRDPKMPDGSTGVMPAFVPAKISDQQARELYEYIQQVIEHPVRK
jgi:mono/diheme cytochrome c family protein